MNIIVIWGSILIVVLICFSFFSSYSEMAISSLNKIRLQTIKSDSKKLTLKIKRLLYLYDNPNQTITTIVIFNNIINIFSTILATVVFGVLFDPVIGSIVSFIVMTLVIILFGEIFPKILAKKDAEKASLHIANYVFYLEKILKPFSIPFNKLVKNEKKALLHSTKEIEMALNESKNFNITTKSESLMLSKILKLDQILVEQIMSKPSVKYDVLDISINQKNLNKLIFNHKRTRFPVLKNGKPIGIFNAFEYTTSYLKNKKYKFDIKDFMFDVSKFEITTNLNEALNILQSKRRKMGVVVDDKGFLLGIITIEDIIEELTGEMYDETDNTKDGVYFIDGKALITEQWVKMSYILKKYLKEISNKIEFKKNQTIFEWVLEKTNLKVLPDKGSFSYENMIIWFEKNEKTGNYKFELDLV